MGMIQSQIGSCKHLQSAAWYDMDSSSEHPAKLANQIIRQNRPATTKPQLIQRARASLSSSQEREITNQQTLLDGGAVLVLRQQGSYDGLHPDHKIIPEALV